MKKKKVSGLIYYAKGWETKFQGSRGMPSATDFCSAYKDDIIGAIKFEKILFSRPILQILEVLMACLAQMSLVNDCEVDSKIG